MANKKTTPKLYEMLTELRMDRFLKQFDTDLSKMKAVELREPDFFGDFICIGDWRFKIIRTEYQCLQTPTASHKKQTVYTTKAPNDHYKRK